jgi:hyperosmotically inducible periplasmic protein
MNEKHGSIIFVAVLAGALCLGGCTRPEDKVHESWKTPEPKAQVDDATLADMLKSALRADPETKNLDVRVETHNGEIVLSGTASNQAQMDRAVMLAWMAEGVKKVDNKLNVAGGGMAPAAK